MRTDAKAAVLGFLFGLGSTVASMSLPQAYPEWPVWVWRLLFWGGITAMAVSALVLGYEWLIRPRLRKRGKMAPLIAMGICLLAFLLSGRWFIVDRSEHEPAPAKPALATPATANEIATAVAEKTRVRDAFTREMDRPIRSMYAIVSLSMPMTADELSQSAVVLHVLSEGTKKRDGLYFGLRPGESEWTELPGDIKHVMKGVAAQ